MKASWKLGEELKKKAPAKKPKAPKAVGPGLANNPHPSCSPACPWPPCPTPALAPAPGYADTAASSGRWARGGGWGAPQTRCCEVALQATHRPARRAQAAGEKKPKATKPKVPKAKVRAHAACSRWPSPGQASWHGER